MTDAANGCEGNARKCPYCAAWGDYPHLLLVVDTTFRNASGGVLKDAFNERWHALCEQGGDEFDEREPFDLLLEEVDSLADAAHGYDDEGGPGMSAAHVIYHVRSEGRAREAVAHFTVGAK